jgi:hypothetical protein
VKEAGFKYLHTQNLNQDPLESLFGAVCLYCGSNDNLAVEAQKDIGAAVHAGDMEVFSLAYVSGSTARQVRHGVSCVSSAAINKCLYIFKGVQ